MKIKLDETLPLRLATRLKQRGHDVHTVPDEGLAGNPDDAIWKAAGREARRLVTQDLDFSDIRGFQPGTHPGLLLVRLRSLPPSMPSPTNSTIGAAVSSC